MPPKKLFDGQFGFLHSLLLKEINFLVAEFINLAFIGNNSYS